jgi:hypothetical protein
MFADEINERVWRVDSWLRASGHAISRVTLYNEIHRGRIQARKCGRATVILTSPREYFESLPSQIGPAVGHARRKAEAAT